MQFQFQLSAPIHCLQYAKQGNTKKYRKTQINRIAGHRQKVKE